MSFNFGSPMNQNEIKQNREPVVCVEKVRSGLFCVNFEWKGPSSTFQTAQQIQQSASVGGVGSIGLPTPSAVSAFSFGNLNPTTPVSFSFSNQLPIPIVSTLPAAPASPLNNDSGASTSYPNPVEQKLAEYHTSFTIEEKPLAFNVAFTNSNSKILAALTLTLLKSKPNSAIKNPEEQLKDESIVSKRKTCGLLDTDYPCAVWANLNGGKIKFQTFKKSRVSERYWISDKFDGSFARSAELALEASSSDWKPLKSQLWIEFENFSSSEKNLIKQLSNLFSQQENCDVQFTLEGPQQIGAHANILAARSPVFSAMFQHDMKEAKTGQVTVEDIQPDIFRQLLQYIYSGRICQPLTETTAQPLFVAADKYDIEDLRKECVAFLLSCIRVDNAINLLVWSHLHSVDELKDAALSFTARHGKEICLLKDWEELTKNFTDLCLEATRRIIGRMSLSPNELENLARV